MSKFSYEKLLDALDLHHNILHAEKQAINARDLDTIEELLPRKDESLDLLIFAKSETNGNFPEEVSSRINSVLSLQKSNSENFRKLHIQDSLDKPETIENSNPLFRRAKRAYS